MDVKQDFKSIYFPDINDDETSSKSLTLAFSDQEKDIFDIVKNWSSHQVRNIIGS